jgi:succinate dehydrogenase flavin-adding protein (antitoxin of CptAB toxin-antitoxin module)
LSYLRLLKKLHFLDHCVYHYDGKGALGHLDDILAIPDIDVIQWVPGDGNPRSIEWMDLLHKIQAAGKGSLDL